jgi:hypothetical protein
MLTEFNKRLYKIKEANAPLFSKMALKNVNSGGQFLFMTFCVITSTKMSKKNFQQNFCGIELPKRMSS